MAQSQSSDEIPADVLLITTLAFVLLFVLSVPGIHVAHGTVTPQAVICKLRLQLVYILQVKVRVFHGKFLENHVVLGQGPRFVCQKVLDAT